jgi:hypothetical protein
MNNYYLVDFCASVACGEVGAVGTLPLASLCFWAGGASGAIGAA